MSREAPTTIAILGGNTVAGIALALLLSGVGYETEVLKAPPRDQAQDPLKATDLLVVSPGLGEERCRESLSVLRDTIERLRIPVLTFSSAVEEGLFGAESSGATWPVEIGGLARAIEAALGGKAELGTAIVANAVGGTALP